MSSGSRTTNSIRNISANVIYQLFIILINFISRWLFVRIFDASYLGINGLFSNILNILSLAELGVGGAIVYSMYKPMYDGDTKKIAALINYYHVLYNRIAIIVAAIGLVLLPFLKYFVNLDGEFQNLELYYLLYLLSTVASYLFVYKTSVISVAQQDYKLKIYNVFFTIIRFLLQIIVLVIFKSFLLYTIVQIIVPILNNLYISYKAEKWFPYIKDNYELDNIEKKSIWMKIKSMFFYQIGGVILNNTDNILISSLVGTVTLGIYSNYSLIISSVGTGVSLVFLGIHSSLGNLNASEDNEKKELVFRTLNMLGFWIYGFCVVCFCTLTQDFITMFFGENFIIDTLTLYVAVANFYIMGSLYPIACYRNTIGLFNDTKYIMVFASIINLVLSVFLGMKYGLIGILMATAIARLATNVWYEPLKLYQIYFKKSALNYFKSQVINLIIILVLIFLTQFCTDLISISNRAEAFFIKIIICVIVSNVLYFIRYKNTIEFKYMSSLIKMKLNK